jgi:hypothetical protein
VNITLNPWVAPYGATGVRCIEGDPPCTPEQEALNVIENHPQDKYVPWLICMDKNGDDLDRCDSEVGISKPASSAPRAVLERHFQLDMDIQFLPYVKVDGKPVVQGVAVPNYSQIRTALCSIEPSLTGCSKEIASISDNKIQQVCEKPADMVVV